MFSVTGNILPGSCTNPSFVTLVPNINTGYNETRTNAWKITLWIPGVSTITGLALALTGTIHAIVHLVCALFDKKNREGHLKEAKLGGINIVYGIVGMIPAVGNIAIMIKDTIDGNANHALVGSREYCKLYVDEDWASIFKENAVKIFKELGFTATNPPGFWDQVNVMQNHLRT